MRCSCTYLYKYNCHYPCYQDSYSSSRFLPLPLGHIGSGNSSVFFTYTSVKSNTYFIVTILGYPSMNFRMEATPSGVYLFVYQSKNRKGFCVCISVITHSARRKCTRSSHLAFGYSIVSYKQNSVKGFVFPDTGHL